MKLSPLNNLDGMEKQFKIEGDGLSILRLLAHQAGLLIKLKRFTEAQDCLTIIYNFAGGESPTVEKLLSIRRKTKSSPINIIEHGNHEI